MKNSCLLFGFLFLIVLNFSCLVEAATEKKLYIGTDSTQAILTFKGKVERKSNKKPAERAALNQIEQQVTHLFGPMGEADIQAVPKGDHKISNIKIRMKDSQTAEITYLYKGTIVVKNKVGNSYQVILPVNPDTIYKDSMVGDYNPCTDEHYQSEGDFWYFWNPKKSGCELRQNQDYLILKGYLQKTQNTKISYPEYDRLADKNGLIKISVLMGMDDPNKDKDPNTSDDINADNFRSIKKKLLSSGFVSKKWNHKKILSLVPKEALIPYVEEFTKTISNEKFSRPIKMKIIVSFSPSGIDEDSMAFHYLFKDALENSSVMIYDGHSGLGGHLDLQSIEEQHQFTISPNPNRYQIYFFNSCSSYTYYNTMFFERKRTTQDPNGTKNLEILTNGLATYFYVMHDTNLALIKAIELWASSKVTYSYQAIAKQIDSGNLFGINGDEDNPTDLSNFK